MALKIKTGNEPFLKKLQREILDVLDEIVRVCEANNLKYYLIGGTLLGAVRHKGFIPWDDDLDIVMPRKDFEKFVNICYKQLNSPYKLNWITTNNEYPLMFAKVYNENTLFSTRFVDYGIFVDIFPLDETFGYTKKTVIKKRVLKTLTGMIFDKATLNVREVPTIKKFFLKFCSIEKLNKIATRVVKMNGKKNADHYTNFSSQYGVKKQTMPKDYYGEGVILPFEDREYRAPNKYIEVIKSIFGDSYMQLPPEDKRGNHYICKIIFSDGEIVEL